MADFFKMMDALYGEWFDRRFAAKFAEASKHWNEGSKLEKMMRLHEIKDQLPQWRLGDFGDDDVDAAVERYFGPSARRLTPEIADELCGQTVLTLTAQREHPWRWSWNRMDSLELMTFSGKTNGDFDVISGGVVHRLFEHHGTLVSDAGVVFVFMH